MRAMTAPHVIRLGSHWQAIGVQSSAAHRPLAEWLGGTGAGPRNFERRFGCPSGIEPGMRITLEIDGIDGRAELNGEPLGALTADSLPRFDVTQRLRERNTLRIVVAENAAAWSGDQKPSDEASGPVWLEIDAGGLPLPHDPSPSGRGRGEGNLQ